MTDFPQMLFIYKHAFIFFFIFLCFSQIDIKTRTVKSLPTEYTFRRIIIFWILKLVVCCDCRNPRKLVYNTNKNYEQYLFCLLIAFSLIYSLEASIGYFRISKFCKQFIYIDGNFNDISCQNRGPYCLDGDTLWEKTSTIYICICQ